MRARGREPPEDDSPQLLPARVIGNGLEHAARIDRLQGEPDRKPSDHRKRALPAQPKGTPGLDLAPLRARLQLLGLVEAGNHPGLSPLFEIKGPLPGILELGACLLYTSDAADERSSVD